MAGNLKKFVNPRFIKTIDLTLMRALLARHDGKFKGFSLDLLDQDEVDARKALQEFLAGAEENYPEGLRGDLHRIAVMAGEQRPHEGQVYGLDEPGVHELLQIARHVESPFTRVKSSSYVPARVCSTCAGASGTESDPDE